jgi:hypothetical protein
VDGGVGDGIVIEGTVNVTVWIIAVGIAPRGDAGGLVNSHIPPATIKAIPLTNAARQPHWYMLVRSLSIIVIFNYTEPYKQCKYTSQESIK